MPTSKKPAVELPSQFTLAEAVAFSRLLLPPDGLERSWITRCVQNGTLPARKTGEGRTSPWLIRRADFLRFLQDRPGVGGARPRNAAPKVYPKATVDAVARLHRAGKSQRAIAEQLGLSTKVVWRMMRNHGIGATTRRRG